MNDPYVKFAWALLGIFGLLALFGELWFGVINTPVDVHTTYREPDYAVGRR